MLDIGWTEMALIAVIALVVVGPKDLPHVIRGIGRWSGKARKYTREFQRNLEGIAEESELSAVRRELEEANRELAAARSVGGEKTTGPALPSPSSGNGASPAAARAVSPSAPAPVAPAPSDPVRPAAGDVP